MVELSSLMGAVRRAAVAALLAWAAVPAAAWAQEICGSPRSRDELTGIDTLRRSDLKLCKTRPGSVLPFVLGGRRSFNLSVVGISFVRAGRPSICTGTLLNGTTVLTAGHCGCGDPASYRVTQFPVIDGSSFPVAIVGAPIPFDRRICATGQVTPGYDLALLKLREKLPVQVDIDPVPPLAGRMEQAIRPGTLVTAVGYGLTEKLTSGIRMQADIAIYTPDCAKRAFALAGCAPFLEMIVADTIGGGVVPRDTCKGDSGGPVFLRPPPGPGSSEGAAGHSILIGVTSRPAPFRQFDQANHCGGGGIYTVIGRTDVRAWLQQNGVAMPAD